LGRLLFKNCAVISTDVNKFDRLGKYEEALEDANVTIAVKPDWGKGYFRKGLALNALGRVHLKEFVCTKITLEEKTTGRRHRMSPM
jgi:hypothetical protein